MDSKLRNLLRAYDANPDAELAHKLVAHYRRAYEGEEQCTAEYKWDGVDTQITIARETLDAALAHDDVYLPVHNIEEGSDSFHLNISEYNEVGLDSITKLAKLLNIKEENIEIDVNSIDNSSCGCCAEWAYYVRVDIPRNTPAREPTMAMIQEMGSREKTVSSLFDGLGD